MDNNNQFNQQQNYQQPYRQSYQQNFNGMTPPQQPPALKNGLGIVSLILGIVGLLSGCIGIGVIFDIVAIILGIIAIASKKHKSGLGIAGLVIGAVGIVLTILFYTVFSSMFGDSEKGEAIIKSAQEEMQSVENSKDEPIVDDSKEIETVADDKEFSEDDLDIQEYSYENSIGDTLYFLTVKNNSDKTLSISANATAYDSNNGIIGANSGNLDALGSNCESILYVYFDSVSSVDHFEYTLSVKEETYFQSVLQDIDCQVTQQSDKVIVSLTNKGTDPAQFVEAYALFFNGDELIGYGSTYIIDDDSELKPNVTLSEQITSYDAFDNVKVFITGRK